MDVQGVQHWIFREMCDIGWHSSPFKIPNMSLMKELEKYWDLMQHATDTTKPKLDNSSHFPGFMEPVQLAAMQFMMPNKAIHVYTVYNII